MTIVASRGVVPCLLAAVVATGTLGATRAHAGASATASRACSPRVLRADASLRRVLSRTHHALERRGGGRPQDGDARGRIYYGRCAGGDYWAVAAFVGRETGLTDQPERFERSPGGRWRDRGDTGNPLPDVPRALLRAWHYRFVWRDATAVVPGD